MSRRITPWLCWGTLTLLAFLVGWRQAHSSASPQVTKVPGVIPVPGVTTAESVSPLTASPDKWQAAWDSASPARRALLVEFWQERDPGALYAFLRHLPPLSIAGQSELEELALLNWGKKEAVAAYTATCAVKQDNDQAGRIINYWLDKNLDQALELVTLRYSLQSWFGYESVPSVTANPERICEALAHANSSVCRDMLFYMGSKAWLAKDPAAAIAFARSLPDADATMMMRGFVEALPVEAAADLVLNPGKPGLTKELVGDLVVRWGREDAPAAMGWAAKHLPPAGFAHALENIAADISSPFQTVSDDALAHTAAVLPPAAWQLVIADNFSEESTTRLIPYAPEWALPEMAASLNFSASTLSTPESTPEWFTKLPPQSAAVVVESYFASRGGEYESAADPAALEKIPLEWRAAAAAGLEKARAAAGGGESP